MYQCHYDFFSKLIASEHRGLEAWKLIITLEDRYLVTVELGTLSNTGTKH